MIKMLEIILNKFRSLARRQTRGEDEQRPSIECVLDKTPMRGPGFERFSLNKK